LLDGAEELFGGRTAEPAAAIIDLKTLHAKIGE
jgi:hypothetical protein